MRRDDIDRVTIDEVRNRGHLVGERAQDLVRAVGETQLAQRAAVAAGIVAAAMSTGFFLGARRRRS